MSSEYNFVEVDYNPFAAGEIEKTIVSIEPQQEIWAACVIGGDDANRSYNESSSLHLKGSFQRAAMEMALQEIVNRHEALRSTFSADGRQMCINKNMPLARVYEDLSDKTPADQKQYLADFIKKEVQTSFDLSNGPLFRAALFKLAEKEHQLTLTAHHIICDGWSFGIILEDLGALYSAYAKGETPSLEPAIGFSHYAAEMQALSATESYKKTEQYWVDQYKGNVPELDVPTDYPRPVYRTYKSRRDDYSLDQELIAAVRKTGGKAGSSLVSTLMVAFEVYLHRLTGQRDIVLGLPSAGQSATGNVTLVGHCVNLLPMRSAISGDSSFITHLKLRRGKILDDYEHQAFTFGSLLKRLNIARNPSRIPLVPVVFNIDMGMDGRSPFLILIIRERPNAREYENFEIFLNATGTKQSLVLEWSYNTQLFKPGTIKRMMDGFENLLREIVANPEIRIRDISITDANLANQVSAWNNTDATYSKDKPVTILINEIAAQYPDKTAIYFDKQQLSYKYLNDQANRLANYLVKQDVKTGDIVGLAIDRSPEMIIALLAIMKSGAAYVPLDPQYPANRINFMLSDSSARLLLTSGAHKGRFESKAKEIVIEEVWPTLSAYPASIPTIKVGGDDLAYVLYTSGSTGKPKGVQVRHHNLVNFLLSMQKMPGITPKDNLLAVTTISFDIAGLELYLPLITGASIVLTDTATTRDGRILLQLLEEKQVSIMQATPSTWRMLLDAGWTKNYSLKVLCGGEAFPKDLVEKLLTKCQSVWNLYGPTETTIWSSVKQLTDADTIITVGRPIANTQFYILDEYQNLVSPGTPGEICIGGEGVAKGYLNRQELTKEKFVNNPYSKKPAAKMYRTGDSGKFLDNGEIQCLGRIDQQVKLRGYRIELGEIEHALSAQSGVKEAVVIAREDNPGDQRLVAYIVPETNIQEEQLQTWKNALRELLPEYMIPSAYVLLEQLPTTSNGKIDRLNLPKPTQDQAQTNAGVFIAPRTEMEKLVAKIWSELLDIEDISVTSNFFELGGHSLIAVRVMLGIEKETGKRLPLATLFENSTIEKLAEIITADEESLKWDSLVPIKTTGSKAPIYLIHGGGLNVLVFKSLEKYMDEEQPLYAMQALGLNGKTELLYTIGEIAARYNTELLENNPHGPYVLAGYSMGGAIAYEMAKQLKKMGKEIKLLGILDTFSGNRNFSESKSIKIKKKTFRQFRKAVFFGKAFINNPKETLSYQYLIIKKKISRRFSSKYKVSEEFFTYEDEINRSYDIAYESYVPEPMDVKVDLFRTKKRIYFLDDPIYLGWKEYAKRGVVVHEVPGDHKTFLFPPHDKDFAEILQEALNKA